MKIINNNKRELRNYEILNTYEAGIVLEGWEVKSARASKVTLNNSYCSFVRNELFLVNSHFSQYMQVKCDESKDRKLLLHKKELAKIKFKLESLKLTIIPTKIYFDNKSNVKVEIALVKGLRKYDKRQKLIQEEVNKRISKTIKNYY